MGLVLCRRICGKFDVYQGADQGQGNKGLPFGIPVIDEKLKNAGIYGNEDVELYFDNFHSWVLKFYSRFF